MKSFYTICAILFCGLLHSQSLNNQPPFTPATLRLSTHQQRVQAQENSLVNQVPFRSIGPSVFSGRVVDIAVSPKDPTHFYVAYASGGLWKTENNGMSFQPLFDKEIVMTIGDLAVDWARNTIWVGTGEVNSSRSSYAGVGIFKSEDGGKTWQHRGLEETHHIGRVVLHPTNPNIVWVAALGHLYSPNRERGIYKTIDGGKTWQQTLFVNENAGAVDLVIDPVNPNILYTSTWERTRRAWDFVESGAGSAIYKSTDGGNTWTSLNSDKSGFPKGEGVGRIGLAIAKDKTVLYAILDNYARRPKKEDETQKEVLMKNDFKTMTKSDFLALEEKKLTAFLRDNNFPRKYDVKTVINLVKSDNIKPIALAQYLEDANSLLFDTEVIGAEVYRSEDAGKTWTKTHDKYLDAVYNSYGYYFGQITVAPNDVNKIYILGVPVLRSDDGGKNWKSINGDNVHSDHHILWADPNRAGHLILGNDGGINISYDDGTTWNKCNTPPVGQFYYIAIDDAKPYNVYGGLQDNGVWKGPSTYSANLDWHDSGDYPYKRLLGGDGMQVAVDTRDNATVYTGFQFGNYFRIQTNTGERKSITPKHELGERPLRWNWQTPIHLSKHNQDILYMGSNKLHRSLNQGDSFETISGDLTTGGKTGDVAFSTLSTIHESPLKFGLLYVGSDDGLVHVTQNGGGTWENITNGLPKNMWVARIQASQHNEATVYVCLNGYRWDDFKPYVYKSTNYGKTWELIGKDLPHEPVNVIKEDPINPNLIYIGTDHSLMVSLDGGKTMMAMQHQLPNTPIHDLVIHPTAKELLVGTHGRSIYITSVREVQQLTEEVLTKNIYAFAIEKLRRNPRWGASWASWYKTEEPQLAIPFYTNTKTTVEISITPEKKEDLVLFKMNTSSEKGINYATYHYHLQNESVEAFQKYLDETEKEKIELKKADNEKYYLPKGNYTITLTKGTEAVKTKLILE